MAAAGAVKKITINFALANKSVTFGIGKLKTYHIMNIPASLRYSKDHEWLRLEGDTAVVGITDYAQSQLGDIVFLDIPSLGENLAQHAVFGSIEAVKTVSDAFLPVAGEIVEFNDKLNDNPALVNTDPYGEGWIIKVKVADPSQVAGLLTAEEYSKIIA